MDGTAIPCEACGTRGEGQGGDAYYGVLVSCIAVVMYWHCHRNRHGRDAHHPEKAVSGVCAGGFKTRLGTGRTTLGEQSGRPARGGQAVFRAREEWYTRGWIEARVQPRPCAILVRRGNACHAGGGMQGGTGGRVRSGGVHGAGEGIPERELSSQRTVGPDAHAVLSRDRWKDQPRGGDQCPVCVACPVLNVWLLLLLEVGVVCHEGRKGSAAVPARPGGGVLSRQDMRETARDHTGRKPRCTGASMFLV